MVYAGLIHTSEAFFTSMILVIKDYYLTKFENTTFFALVIPKKSIEGN